MSARVTFIMFFPLEHDSLPWISVVHLAHHGILSSNQGPCLFWRCCNFSLIFIAASKSQDPSRHLCHRRYSSWVLGRSFQHLQSHPCTLADVRNGRMSCISDQKCSYALSMRPFLQSGIEWAKAHSHSMSDLVEGLYVSLMPAIFLNYFCGFAALIFAYCVARVAPVELVHFPP